MWICCLWPLIRVFWNLVLSSWSPSRRLQPHAEPAACSAMFKKLGLFCASRCSADVRFCHMSGSLKLTLMPFCGRKRADRCDERRIWWSQSELYWFSLTWIKWWILSELWSELSLIDKLRFPPLPVPIDQWLISYLWQFGVVDVPRELHPDRAHTVRLFALLRPRHPPAPGPGPVACPGPAPGPVACPGPSSSDGSDPRSDWQYLRHISP